MTGIIKENLTITLMKNKRIIIILGIIVCILLVPLTAMQFSNEVNWDLTDFIVAGALLLITGLGFELIMRKVINIKYRRTIIIALFIAFFLTYVELAVGLFGSPFAGN